MANIIVCSDGTWNRPEKDDDDTPTNVLRVARAITPENQHVYYDWGVGSYHDVILGGITGKGLAKNITDGYRYIVQNYKDGDKIYLFGFSRGAYTSRAISGLINNCGILKREEAHLIEEAWDIYRNESEECKPEGEESKRFRSQYSHPSKQVHFVGVWDTIGALGIPFSVLGLFDKDEQFYDSKVGPNVSFARHALAIDEKRSDYSPTIWQNRAGVNLKQMWFAGVHCDVGGSYSPDQNTRLASDTALRWIVEEAQAQGLAIEEHLLNKLAETNTPTPLPELNESRIHFFRLKRPKDRKLRVSKTIKVHPSVKVRYDNDPNYRPDNLTTLLKSKGWEDILDM